MVLSVAWTSETEAPLRRRTQGGDVVESFVTKVGELDKDNEAG